MMNQKKMVVRKLKICKFSLVSKICYFFGKSFMCFLAFLMVGGGTCGGEAVRSHIFAFQSWTDFRASPVWWWLERKWRLFFEFWAICFGICFRFILPGAGLPDFGKAFKFWIFEPKTVTLQSSCWVFGSDLFLNFSSADESKQSQPKRQTSDRTRGPRKETMEKWRGISSWWAIPLLVFILN